MAQVRRLGPDDVVMARRAFTMLEEVFEGDAEPLSDRYLADDEDEHALACYRAIGGRAVPVTMFDLGAG